MMTFAEVRFLGLVEEMIPVPVELVPFDKKQWDLDPVHELLMTIVLNMGNPGIEEEFVIKVACIARLKSHVGDELIHVVLYFLLFHSMEW